MPASKKGRKEATPAFAGGFAAVPRVVIESAEFHALSHAAVRLLLCLTLQWNPKAHNNGKLVCCKKWAVKHGFKSNNTIQRARVELEKARLLFCSRKGRLPNTAAWYALTWHALDWNEEMDCDRHALIRFKNDKSSVPTMGARVASTTPAMGAKKCG